MISSDWGRNGGGGAGTRLVFELFRTLRFGKRHVQGNPYDNRLPGFVLREPLALYGTPQVNDFFFRNAFENILITLSV